MPNLEEVQNLFGYSGVNRLFAEYEDKAEAGDRNAQMSCYGLGNKSSNMAFLTYHSMNADADGGQ